MNILRKKIVFTNNLGVLKWLARIGCFSKNVYMYYCMYVQNLNIKRDLTYNNMDNSLCC